MERQRSEVRNRGIIAIVFILFSLPVESARQIVELDCAWRFHHGQVKGAEQTGFDDSAWKYIDVPHDWAFETARSEEGGQGERGGYYGAGIGWYRKSFQASTDWSDKHVSIEFDGVYMNSEVWINGHYLGKRPYGYISFVYDLTPHLRTGANTLAVRVDNSLEPSTRWYHPCGIYAPVRLVITSPCRIARNGVYITTPVIDDTHAVIKIHTALDNLNLIDAAASLKTELLNSAGIVVASPEAIVFSNKHNTVDQTIEIANPNRWDINSPVLYTAVSRLEIENKMVDEVRTTFGIRSIEWKEDTGFWLNGKNVKLRGVCEHLEGGPIGGAWTRQLMQWKLQILKDMGVNAIRTAHNPAVPVFYDLCDQMGIMVMDEVFDGWKQKAEHDYGAHAFDQWWRRDVTEWIMRDRNHPSIIIYSVGNETRGPVAADLVKLCHSLDSTRPVTSGHSGSEFMDVFGVNGHCEKKSFFTEERPAKPFVATEAPHTWQTRGYYRTKTWYRDGYPNLRADPFEIPDLTKEEIFSYEWAPPEKRQNDKQFFRSSYDNATVRISVRQILQFMRDLPWYSGLFQWTGFDYYGESAYVHGGWPFRMSMAGPIDTAGFKKDLYYLFQSQWTDSPMVHILPHWTHPKMPLGTLIPVWVYTNTQKVELFLNGRSLGTKSPGTSWDQMQCQWMVPWQPGVLKAVGSNDGKIVASAQHSTAQAPSRLRLDVQSEGFHPNGTDLAVLTVAVEDAKGIFYPYGENRVYFHFDGPVRLRSLENGSPVDTDKHVDTNSRRAFMGLTRAFLQSTRQSGSVSAVAGAILGERQHLTSNLIAIDVRQIAIRGELHPKSFDIYYTTDGKTPTHESLLYKKPFEVLLGTTVKSLVRSGGKDLFIMEETFSKDAGLYWGHESFDASAAQIGMQAETATFDGPQIAASGQGFRGKGYLDFNNKEGSVSWYQENDGSAGPFTLRLRYALNDKNGSRQMDLYINNRKTAALAFDNTGSWDKDWKTIETVQLLDAGANNIELRTIGQSGPNLDELLVSN